MHFHKNREGARIDLFPETFGESFHTELDEADNLEENLDDNRAEIY